MNILEQAPANELHVVTFPIGTRSDAPKLGLSVPSIVARVFADNMGGDFTLAVNTIDSYVAGREKYIDPYLGLLDNVGGTPDHLWHDLEMYEELSEIVNTLIKSGHLVSESRDIEVCACGKVERLSGAKIQPGARLYNIYDGDRTACIGCDSECQITTTDVLVMKFSDDLVEPVVMPSLMKGEIKELTSRLRGMEFLASRCRRQTGIEIEVGGKRHWLDVDFFWSNYLASIGEGAQLVVGTNHVAWHLTLAHALLQSYDKDRANRSTLLLAPYILDKSGFEARQRLNLGGQHAKRIGLFILMNLAWSQQSSSWDANKLRYLDKVTDSELEEVWNDITSAQVFTTDATPEQTIKQVVDRVKTDAIIAAVKKVRRHHEVE